METKFRKSFEKDLQKIKSNQALAEVLGVIQAVESAQSIKEIRQLKKLKGNKFAYRIRVKEYRIGLFIENRVADFARILHRKDIYKYFP